jgi:hypothetical protein
MLHATPRVDVLAPLRRDPSALFAHAGMTADAWQRRLLLDPTPRQLVLCSRQAGKSTSAAALALSVALTTPGALILLVSPSQRQSGELFHKVLTLYRQSGKLLAGRAESALRIELANGARIIALPGEEGTLRGYSSVNLLIVDEASRVPDALYLAVRPMLAVSQGRLVALTTPFGQRGWFHQAWQSSEPWGRYRVTATECPRIDPAFLAEERMAMGERWYRQEYLCDFVDTVDAVFAAGDIAAALNSTVQPLF